MSAFSVPENNSNISSIVRLLPSEQEIHGIVSSWSDLQAEVALHDWTQHARPEQLPPEGDWSQWLFLAGRGAGKTRAGAEWVRAMVKAGFNHGALIAPTASDARDVMVEGSSGILATAWSKDTDINGRDMGVPVYEPTKRRVHWANGAMVTTFSEPTKRRVHWANGAMVTTFSAEEPDRLRGPQGLS